MIANITKNDLQRYLQFFLLVLSAGAIYPLIYLRTNFQSTIVEVFQIKVSDLNQLYTTLGVMFVLGYIPSGWLADKISIKILLTISLGITGLVGLWFAQIPSTASLNYIFLIWGISSVFTFWGALIKSVKMLAKAEEQSRFFGILDGGRGVVEALLATIAVVVFSYMLTQNNTSKDALVGVIYLYSFICIVCAILIFIFLEKEQKNDLNKEEASVFSLKSLMRDIIRILKIKEVWILSMIIFCGYTLFWNIYFFSGFLQANHGATAIVAGYVTVLTLWMRPIGGILGGVLGDKFNRANILGVAFATASLGVLLLSFIPQGSNVIMVFAMVLIIGLMLYAIRGLYWSFLDYCNIPNSILGFAIGIISFLGYLPDIILPIISAKIFLANDNGPIAYTQYFLITSIVGIVGTFLIFYLGHHIKKRKY